MLDSYREPKIGSPKVHCSPAIWSPSPPKKLKLNADATILNPDLFGMGSVIRDHMGFPIHAWRKW